MPTIKTETGSATSPRAGSTPVIVAHLCNNVGAWGAGFVLAVSELSPIPERAYKHWKRIGELKLGQTQFTEVLPGLFYANMIAQDDIKKTGDGVLVDYQALERCLKVTLMRAARLGAQVHFPAGMGSGLAGGDKGKIVAMIERIAGEVEKTEVGLRLEAMLQITLWEFKDTSAASYIAPKTAVPTVAPTTDPLANMGT